MIRTAYHRLSFEAEATGEALRSVKDAHSDDQHWVKRRMFVEARQCEPVRRTPNASIEAAQLAQTAGTA